MPEGHTLHRIARALDEAFAGTSPEVSSPQGRFAQGAALLDGTRVDHAEAWGKHLFVEFAADRWLHVHLGLIGTFVIDSAAYVGELPVTGQIRLRMRSEAHVADLRGPMTCAVADPERVETVLAGLGPDPLRAPHDPDTDPDRAWHRIHRSRKTIAELLMDQSVVAGVGNVYRCEVLFRNRVHPLRSGVDLKPATWRRLWGDLVTLMPLGVATGRIVTVLEQVAEVEQRLRQGLDVTLTERESYVYRRAGEPCRLCGSRVRSAEVAGRTLYWCGNCQRRS